MEYRTHFLMHLRPCIPIDTKCFWVPMRRPPRPLTLRGIHVCIVYTEAEIFENGFFTDKDDEDMSRHGHLRFADFYAAGTLGPEFSRVYRYTGIQV